MSGSSYLFEEALPSGVDLTLSELQEMATRQQQQIEAQQQMLVAKEQRLKFLKQQELRHQQISSENERLRKLREKVEAQELKLKKLRALRGQVDQHKTTNNSLSSELESIKALFNEKEKELAMAVGKVEEMSKQLEDIRRSRINGVNSFHNNSPAARELEKLRQELMVRNKLNEQQNSKLAQHKELLTQRKDEMSMMDRRIAELQARLRKKRAQQQENINTGLSNKSVSNVPKTRAPGANIAAVEPYIKHVPKQESYDDNAYVLNKQDPKYQTLPYSIKFPESKKGDFEQNIYAYSSDGKLNGNDKDTEPLIIDTNQNTKGLEKTSPNRNGQTALDLLPKETVHTPPYTPSVGHATAFEALQETLKKSENVENPLTQPSRSKFGIVLRPTTGMSNYTPRPYGSTYSTAIAVNNRNSVVTTTPQASPTTTTSAYYKTSTPVTASSTGAPSALTPSPREIFITGAPISSPSRVSPMYTSPNTSTSPPVATTSVQDRPNGGMLQDSRVAPPIYQVATSQRQPVTQAQHSTGPSVAGSSGNGTNGAQIGRGMYSRPGGATHTSQGNVAGSGENSDRKPAPGQFAVSNSTKVALSERHSSNSSIPDRKNGVGVSPETSPVSSSSGGSPPQNGHSSSLDTSPNQDSSKQRGVHERQNSMEIKDGVDTSSSSVTSALSVLKSGPSASPTSKPSYRYAPKSVIANTYTRKLGSSALDQYRKNMEALYKDFVPGKMGGAKTDDRQPGSPTAKVRPLNINRPESPTKQTGEGEGEKSGVYGNHLAHQMQEAVTSFSQVIESGPMMEAPASQYNTAMHELDRRHRTNAPRPLRRRLSSSDTDELPNKAPLIPSDLVHLEENGAVPPGGENRTGPPPDVIRVDTIQKDYEMANEKSMQQKKEEEISEMKKSQEARKDSHIPLPLRVKKTNLKAKNSVNRTRRVSFDPLALLLDASLEGELELVMRTAGEVSDPSAANDEGITALHNAICAGHYEIVKFLVTFGCNVNSPDSDGWTPLHCAASCNNLPMVKFLVEHGACIFATTISDHETAAEKCEEDEDGYDGCSEYLYSVQEKLGILNKGAVFAVFDYQAQNTDELSFRNSTELVVLRKGDEHEKDWWWARNGDREGYIPRNLLGLSPRVKPPPQLANESDS